MHVLAWYLNTVCICYTYTPPIPSKLLDLMCLVSLSKLVQTAMLPAIALTFFIQACWRQTSIPGVE